MASHSFHDWGLLYIVSERNIRRVWHEKRHLSLLLFCMSSLSQDNFCGAVEGTVTSCSGVPTSADRSGWKPQFVNSHDLYAHIAEI